MWTNKTVMALRNAVAMNNTNEALRQLAAFDGDINSVNEMGEPLLRQAISQNNPVLVDALVKKGCDPNDPGHWGDPPLFTAIQFRRWPIASQLLDLGASATAKNQSGLTPLGAVLDQWWGTPSDIDARMNLVRALLAHGADPFGPERANSPRSLAEATVDRRDAALTELLFTNKTNPSFRTASGDTPLHLAAAYGITNVLGDLVARGWSIDQTNDDGLTPLQMLAGFGGAELTSFGVGQPMAFAGGTYPSAMQFGIARRGPPWMMVPARSVASVLLSLRAKTDVFTATGLSLTNELTEILSTNAAALNARDSIGRTPLHYAIFATNSAPFELLLSRQADVNAATTRPIRRLAPPQNIPAGATPLHLAALHLKPDFVKRLIDAKANVNAADSEGDTALHLAARLPAKSLAYLIDAHAAVNVTNRAGKTPLRIAIEAGNAENVEALFDAGATGTVSTNGATLLHLAAETYSRDGETIRSLLRHGVKIEARDNDGRTPFLSAAEKNSLGSMVVLLGEGADINAADSAGDTALHYAARQSSDNAYYVPEPGFLERQKMRAWMSPGVRRSIAQRLVKWKIMTAPNFAGTNESVTIWLLKQHAAIATNRAGRTPLHTLCANDWFVFDQYATNRLEKLMQAGARLDAPDSDGITPLHLAYQNGSTALFSWMIDHATNIVDARDKAGSALLRWAITNQSEIRHEREKKFATLVSHSADINFRDQNGNTPLHLVMQRFMTSNGSDQQRLGMMCSLLVSNGANLNSTNNDGLTPLVLMLTNDPSHFATYDQTVREVFVQPAWDWTARDRSGDTAFHSVLMKFNQTGGGHFFSSVLVTALSSRTNLLTVTNADGDTPLHCAIKAGRSELVDTLMSKGADPSVRNNKGDSAYFLAAQANIWNIQQSVRPPGVARSFFESITSHDTNAFMLWLQADPKLCVVTNWSGQTPLHFARAHHLQTFVDRLTALGAKN